MPASGVGYASSGRSSWRRRSASQRSYQHGSCRGGVGFPDGLDVMYVFSEGMTGRGFGATRSSRTKSYTRAKLAQVSAVSWNRMRQPGRESHTQARPNTMSKTKQTSRTCTGVASIHASRGRTKRDASSRGAIDINFGLELVAMRRVQLPQVACCAAGGCPQRQGGVIGMENRLLLLDHEASGWVGSLDLGSWSNGNRRQVLAVAVRSCSQLATDNIVCAQ
jgi:hypothetical protein